MFLLNFLLLICKIKYKTWTYLLFLVSIDEFYHDKNYEYSVSHDGVEEGDDTFEGEVHDARISMEESENDEDNHDEYLWPTHHDERYFWKHHPWWSWTFDWSWRKSFLVVVCDIFVCWIWQIFSDPRNSNRTKLNQILVTAMLLSNISSLFSWRVDTIWNSRLRQTHLQ